MIRIGIQSPIQFRLGGIEPAVTQSEPRGEYRQAGRRRRETARGGQQWAGRAWPSLVDQLLNARHERAGINRVFHLFHVSAFFG
jgi:hypothetical protein